MQTSGKRRKQLEKLIRRIRADVRIFDETAQAIQLGVILRKAKARLMPIYDAESYARRDAEFKRRYAIDTAINCKP